MADRRDYFFLQKLTEAELDAGFDGLEQSLFNVASDYGFVGITIGLEVTQSTVPAITVDIANGVAYSSFGERILIPSAQVNFDISLDDASASTDVAGNNNEKIVSVFIEFDRELADPRTDGNGFTIFHERNESFQISIVQGDEAGAGLAVPPPLDSAKILLTDITRTFEQTQILDGDMDITRRQFTINVESTNNLVIQAGNVQDGILDMLQELDDHINSVTIEGAHKADSILKQEGPGWADGIAQQADNLEVWLNQMVFDLTSTAGKRGLGKITAPAMPNWANGAAIPANIASDQLTLIINNLAGTPAGQSGAQKIGSHAIGGLTHFAGPAGPLHAQISSAFVSIDQDAAFVADNITWPGVHTFSFVVNIPASGKLDVLANGELELSAGSIFDCDASNASFSAGFDVTGGDVDIVGPARVDFKTGSTLVMDSGSNLTLASGINATLNGLLNVDGASAKIELDNGGKIVGLSGSTLDWSGASAATKFKNGMQVGENVGSSLIIKNNCGLFFETGSEISGNMKFEPGFNIDFNNVLSSNIQFFGGFEIAGGDVDVLSGAKIDFKSGSDLFFSSGSEILGVLQFNSPGNDINFNNGFDVAGGDVTFKTGVSTLWENDFNFFGLQTDICFFVGLFQPPERHIAMGANTGRPTNNTDPFALTRHKICKAWAYYDMKNSTSVFNIRDSDGIDRAAGFDFGVFIRINFGFSFTSPDNYSIVASPYKNGDGNPSDPNNPKVMHPHIINRTVNSCDIEFLNENGDVIPFFFLIGDSVDYYGVHIIVHGDG